MQTVEQEVGLEALNEWLEHPMTAWFVAAIESRADLAVNSRANAFYPGDPHKTHETISYLNGSVDELNAIYNAMNEDWEEGEECPLNSLPWDGDDE
jgi:hypothetical protein